LARLCSLSGGDAEQALFDHARRQGRLELPGSGDIAPDHIQIKLIVDAEALHRSIAKTATERFRAIADGSL